MNHQERERSTELNHVVFLVADSLKVGALAPFWVAPARAMQKRITHTLAPASELTEIEALGIAVAIVQVLLKQPSAAREFRHRTRGEAYNA